jgi:hypothetical protein
MDFEIVSEKQRSNQLPRAKEFAAVVVYEGYGGNRWRKLKGVAQVRLSNGRIRKAEIHWYEGHGVGRREFKIKLPFLDSQ